MTSAARMDSEPQECSRALEGALIKGKYSSVIERESEKRETEREPETKKETDRQRQTDRHTDRVRETARGESEKDTTLLSDLWLFCIVRLILAFGIILPTSPLKFSMVNILLTWLTLCRQCRMFYLVHDNRATDCECMMFTVVL